jgi:hypothetical protein
VKYQQQLWAGHKMDPEGYPSNFGGFMPVSMYPCHMSAQNEPSRFFSVTNKDPNNKILTYSEIMESHRRKEALQKRNSATAA